MASETTACDFCDKTVLFEDRRIVALPRPSDPTELVAVMYGCGSCYGSRDLPTAVEIYDAVMGHGEWNGNLVSFVFL